MSRLSCLWLVSGLLLLSACDSSFEVSGGVPTNAAPQGANASLTTAEDTPVVASLSVSDPESDPLTITVTDNVDNGVLTIVADGMGGFDASYAPNPDFNGTDAFVFTVSDRTLTAGPFTVTITVSAENDAPVAAAQTVGGGEDTPLISAVTATDVDGDALTFASVTAPGNGALALNTDGSFTYTPNANYNGADQFSFTANDGTVDSNTAVVTINVAPANDAPIAAADAFMATEDVALSIPAAGLLANDMDIDGDTLTAAVASPPANGMVNIAADGSFVYLPNANFNGADSFTYVANDGTVNSAPATATISVAAVNDIPVAIGGGATSAEDAFVDLVLTGSDVENDALTFSIVAGPASGALSGFDSATGALTYTPDPDFAGNDSFMFRVNDGMADSADAVVTITVTPVNDLPTDIAIDNTVLAEEQPAGTTVGTLSSVDVDAGDTHTYTLVAGAGDTDNPSFAIVGNQLQTAAVLDFETQASYAIRVQSDDGNGGSYEEALAITVTDVNDAPTDIALSNAAIDENQPAGTAVGSLTTTDQDPADTHTYSLVAGAGDADNASFAIVGDQLQTAAVFDFETQNSYSVRVQTDDGAGGTFEEALTITVNDVNEAPTDLALSNGSVDENLAAGTAVGTLSSTDVDSAGPFVYALVAGAGDTDNASFSIVGDQLQTAAVFDFETQNSFAIRVQTDDGAGGTFEEALTITVNDVNDAPTDIALDSTDVDENQPAATLVGTLSSTDVDSAGPFVYALVAGAGDTDNASFSIVGDQLQTAAVFDFETQNSFSVRVQTDDGAGGTFEEALTITVNDVNDAPTDIALDSTDVDENQPAATPVGTLSSTDVDSAGPFVYALVAGAGDTDNASFSIVGDQLQTAAVFDFETQNSFSVRVQTDDGAGGTFEEAFTITVNDVNDAPTDIALDSTDVDENQPAATPVGTLSSTDVDSAGPFVYALVAGAGDTDNASFSIVGDQLQTAAVFDFETQNSFAIRVQTDDGAGGTFEEALTITVNDVNDAPTDIALDSTDVDEGEPSGTPVGTLSSTDVDSAGPFVYALVAGAGDTDNASFSIVGDQLQTAAVFDASVQNSYSIRVQTDDGAGGTFEEAFTITVNSLNDPPTDIGIDSSDVDENQVAGTLVGTFTTTDPDPDTFIYTLVAGAGDTDNAQFTISGDQLLTNAVLNFEAADNCVTSASSCSIRVQTDDQVSGTFQKSFIINIGDINDPPGAADDSYSGAIGNTQLALVAALSGTPPFPATVELVGSVGDNDPDEDGDTVGAVAATVATSQGGSVTIDAAGRFVYRPPAGFTGGNDTFTYTPSDGTDPSASTATVTITLAGLVWYVDDSSPNNPGTGTSADPFRNLSGASPGPTLPGQTIFVYAGTQTTGIALQNNQSLLGEGVALVVGPTTLSNPGTRPVITTAGTAITLGTGNTVRGIDIAGSNTGMVGTAFGTLSADTVAISTTGGAGINLSSGAGTVTFDSLSSSASSGSGIDLNSVSGMFTFGSGSISGSTGTAVDITNSSATINYSGTITAGSNLAVNISGHSANSVSLSGMVNSTGQGIVLNGNTGGTINLSGGMSLSTGAFSGFSATNGGTVNLTGTNTVTTTTASAVIVSDTDIGGSGMTFQSINSSSSSSNVGIVLNNTGSGTFTVTGAGGTCATAAESCTGGTIANKTGDAVTLNDTGGRVTLTSMRIFDIGSTGGGFNTRSQHDAIHGEDVLGGLTLDNVKIRRISDMCINGALFASGVLPTNWVGLDIINSTIEDCNRWHVSGTGDTTDEGAVRIVGLTGTVNIDNSTIQRAGELVDIFTAPTGTLTMTVTNSDFVDAFKEFSSGGTVAIGKFCIDVTVEGSSSANITIGGAGPFPNNEFINCGAASLRVNKDTTPAGNSDIDVIIDNNQFRVTDQTSANGVFGNTPQGGVALRAGPGGINTFDAIVQNNIFGVAVGPDDDVGSTTDEIANSDGVEGNLALILEEGVSQVRVNNNTFNGSINAPWFNRGDGNLSAAVLYENNSYRGRSDYCCDSGFTFRVPGIPYRTRVRNGGTLDITFRNDSFAVHDQFFFAQTENLELESPNIGGGGTLNVCFDNVTSPDGIEFDEDAGAINLYQGANNAAATGPCGVEADGHPISDCELEVADDSVRGGPAGHAQSGAPSAGLSPPHIDVDGGSIAITGTPCTVPSGGIF